MALRDDVAERYPALISLLQEPEIGKLLTQAVQQNWSPGVFQSKFMASRWFQSQSESSRRWWVTAHTDKGEAGQQRTLMQQSIAAKARQLGIQPTRTELQNIREQALRMGLSADDFWVTNALVALASKGGRTDVGAWTTTAEQLKSIGRDQFLKAEPAQVLKKWATWIVTGQRTIEDYQAAAQKEAMHRFPHMVERLQRGETPGDIIAFGRSIIANEWGIDPNAVDLNDADWRKLATGVKDPKTQKTRMLTESETVRLARGHPGWMGGTTNGRRTQAQVGSFLMRALGKRA